MSGTYCHCFYNSSSLQELAFAPSLFQVVTTNLLTVLSCLVLTRFSTYINGGPSRSSSSSVSVSVSVSESSLYRSSSCACPFNNAFSLAALRCHRLSLRACFSAVSSSSTAASLCKKNIVQSCVRTWV